MTKTEMKKLFRERWNTLFSGKRLLAVQLDGFSHTIFYDEKSPRAKVVKGEVNTMRYSGCMSMGEAQSYGMNEPNVCKFFAGFANYQYQENPIEIVFVMPKD